MVVDATRAGAGHVGQWARLLPGGCRAPPPRRAWHALVVVDVLFGFRHSALQSTRGEGTRGTRLAVQGATHNTLTAGLRGRTHAGAVSVSARVTCAQVGGGRKRAGAGGQPAVASRQQSVKWLGPRTASRAVTKPPAGGPPSENGGELGRRCNNTARGALQGE